MGRYVTDVQVVGTWDMPKLKADYEKSYVNRRWEA
jgi:hypothetical protein